MPDPTRNSVCHQCTPVVHTTFLRLHWCLQGIKTCSMIYGSSTPLQSVDQLKDMGYQVVIRPLSGENICNTAL